MKEEGGADTGVRRPMNAFLIFCKRHRRLVREKNPHLDNRSVTRILGELWANLPVDEKASYTALANEYKAAFLKAHPDYKWCSPDRGAKAANAAAKKEAERKKKAAKPSPLKSTTEKAPTSTIPAKKNPSKPAPAPPSSTTPDVAQDLSIKAAVPAGSGVEVPVTVSAPLQYTLPLLQTSVGYISPPPTISYLQPWPQGVTLSTAQPLVATLSDTKIESRMTLAQSYATAAEVKLSTADENAGLTPSEIAEKKRKEGNMALLELAKMCSTQLEAHAPVPPLPTPPTINQPHGPLSLTTPRAPGDLTQLPAAPSTLPVSPYSSTFTETLAKASTENGPKSKPKRKLPQLSEVHRTAPGSENGKRSNKDLATCSRLVVDHVIESMYSHELLNDIKPPTSKPPAVPLSHSSLHKPKPKTSTKVTPPEIVKPKKHDKTSLTFGEIQETLIRRAVENSFEFNLTSDSTPSLSLESRFDTRTRLLTKGSNIIGKELDKENIKKETNEENDPYAFTDPTTPTELEYIPKKFRSSKLKDTNHLHGTKKEVETPVPESTKPPQEPLDLNNVLKKAKSLDIPSNFPTNLTEGLGSYRRQLWMPSDSSSRDLESPNQTACDSEVRSWSGESREEDCDWPEGEDYGLRKSQRSNRGRKYQELIEQGYLQSSRDKVAAGKKHVQGSSPPMSVDDTFCRPEPVYNPSRKRTMSESDCASQETKRFKAGDFDLEAHLASLPPCSITDFSKKGARSKVSKIRHHSDSSAVKKSPPSSHFLNVAQLQHFVRDRDRHSSESSVEKEKVVVKPEPPTSNSVSGSRKRKARRHAITHLIPAHPTPGKSEGEVKPEKGRPEPMLSGDSKPSSRQNEVPAPCSRPPTIPDTTPTQICGLEEKPRPSYVACR